MVVENYPALSDFKPPLPFKIFRSLRTWNHRCTHVLEISQITKACHRQTYQNSKISWQKLPISDFQSEFSMSKSVRIFLIFYFIEEYQFRSTYFVIGFFWKLQFLKHFIKWIWANFLTADFGVLVGLTMTWFSEEMLISNICIRGPFEFPTRHTWFHVLSNQKILKVIYFT